MCHAYSDFSGIKYRLQESYALSTGILQNVCTNYYQYMCIKKTRQIYTNLDKFIDVYNDDKTLFALTITNYTLNVSTCWKS